MPHRVEHIEELEVCQTAIDQSIEDYKQEIQDKHSGGVDLTPRPIQLLGSSADPDCTD